MVRAGKVCPVDSIIFLKSPSFSIFMSPILSISVMNDILVNKQDNSSTFPVVLFYSVYCCCFQMREIRKWCTKLNITDKDNKYHLQAVWQCILFDRSFMCNRKNKWHKKGPCGSLKKSDKNKLKRFILDLIFWLKLFINKKLFINNIGFKI